jgi:GNAT superfamily N-acetyltransferase
MKAMIVQRIEEFRIDPSAAAAIQRLLRACFPDYPPNRTYFRQIPNFRFLAWHGDGQLVGHCAIEHRLINNAGVVLRIFGIADLCVAPPQQHHRLATRLLGETEALARAHGIDCLLLLAKEHGLYLNNGFVAVDNPGKWLLIQNDQTLGVARRSLENSLLVKPLGERIWQSGLVDFLGHIF